MASMASGIFYQFPPQATLGSLLRKKFAADPELKQLADKTVAAIAKFFAGRDIERGQIAGNLQTMASQMQEENLSKGVLKKIEAVFLELQRYGSIPSSNVAPSHDPIIAAFAALFRNS